MREIENVYKFAYRTIMTVAYQFLYHKKITLLPHAQREYIYVLKDYVVVDVQFNTASPKCVYELCMWVQDHVGCN